jgi:hypothetical protein
MIRRRKTIVHIERRSIERTVRSTRFKPLRSPVASHFLFG